jgi:PAS domain S-box-containing protein
MADPPSSAHEDLRTDGKRPHVAGTSDPGRTGVSLDGPTPALSAIDYIRAIIESFPFPAWVKDASGRFVAVNRCFAESVGLAGPGHAIGRTDVDFATPALAARYQADDREVMRTGSAKSVEEFIESGGRSIWVESFKAPVKGPDGSVVGTYGFAREITARKRAQNLLEIQRDLGLALVEAPDIVHTFRVLLDHALRLPDVQGAGVYEVRPDGAFDLRAHGGVTARFVAQVQVMPASVPEVRAFVSGRTLRSWEDFEPGLLSLLHEEGLRAVVILPIAEGGRVIGCLNLATRTRDRVDDDAILALEAMCAHVGHVLQRLRVQSALKESEARWGFALEGAGDGVWDWHVPSGRVFYSHRWKEMLGYSDDEIGDTYEEWASRVHPEDRTGVEREPGRHYRHELPHFATEHRLRRRDGTYMWVLDRGRVVEWDASGVPVRVIGIQSDISGRKRDEAALRESAEFLRDVITSTSDGILVEDGRGRVLIANERFATLWRIPPEMLATGDERAMLEWVLDQLEDPEGFKARVTELAGSERDCMDMIAFKDGRFFERHSSPLMREGRVAGRVWSFRDVTESRRHETLFRSLIAATPDAFTAFDAQLSIIDWSPQAEQLFGWTAAEILGAPAAGRLLPAEEAERLVGGLVEFVRTGQSREIGRVRRQTGLRKDGSEFAAEVQIGASRLGGEWRFSGLFRDITPRIVADERLAQAEKLEAIGQLTGGLAHDFNNILGIVLGNLDLVSASPPEERADLLGAARKAAERGAEVTRALLAIARRQELSPGSVDVNTLIDDLLPLLAHSAGKRIALSFEAWPGSVVSHLDPGGFNNAMLNLVLNARDAMPDGGEIHIRTEVLNLGTDAPAPLVDGAYNLIEVRDTGVGMSPEVAARAFDPFFTTKGRGKGTGLGLAMVYGFARQSGGTAVVRSGVGRGSVFQLYLPALVDDAASQPAEDRPAPPVTVGGRERVLLVDDEPLLLNVVRRWLIDLGYQVTAVSSPGDALLCLAAGKVDVLVSDVIMPGQMDGVDLAAEAERLYPGMAILLISGYPEGLVEKSQGRWRLLDKPFTRDQLDRMVRATVAGRKA